MSCGTIGGEARAQLRVWGAGGGSRRTDKQTDRDFYKPTLLQILFSEWEIPRTILDLTQPWRRVGRSLVHRRCSHVEHHLEREGRHN